MEHYEKTIRQVRADNRHLSEKVIELKGMLKLEKENNDDNMLDKMRRQAKSSSKSKEREKASKKA